MSCALEISSFSLEALLKLPEILFLVSDLVLLSERVFIVSEVSLEVISGISRCFAPPPILFLQNVKFYEVFLCLIFQNNALFIFEDLFLE